MSQTRRARGSRAESNTMPNVYAAPFTGSTGLVSTSDGISAWPVATT